MAQCSVGFRTSGSKSNNAKHALQNAIAAPRVSSVQPSSKLVCVKKPLLLQSIAATTTSRIPEVVVPDLSEWIGRAFFAALAKVNDSYRAEIGSKKQQICTNDSLFAKGESSTSSLASVESSRRCDPESVVQLYSLAAHRTWMVRRCMEFQAELRTSRRLDRSHRNSCCLRNRRCRIHRLLQDQP